MHPKLGQLAQTPEPHAKDPHRKEARPPDGLSSSHSPTCSAYFDRNISFDDRVRSSFLLSCYSFVIDICEQGVIETGVSAIHIGACQGTQTKMTMRGSTLASRSISFRTIQCCRACARLARRSAPSCIRCPRFRSKPVPLAVLQVDDLLLGRLVAGGPPRSAPQDRAALMHEIELVGAQPLDRSFPPSPADQRW